MTIVYYRRPDQSIRHVHEVKNVPADELSAKVSEYNKKAKDTAHIIEVAENSLVAFLMEQERIRGRCDEEAIQDAIDSLYNALDFVRSLAREY